MFKKRVESLERGNHFVPYSYYAMKYNFDFPGFMGRGVIGNNSSMLQWDTYDKSCADAGFAFYF